VLEPDGRTIAFTLTLAPDPARGFGTDIEEVHLDGTALRAIVQHEQESVFYAKPNVDPSGRSLYVSRSDASGSRIERIDLASGQHVTVVADAADPALSPDGRQLVYLHLSSGQPDGLWIAAADGSGAHRLLSTSFFFLQSPRFAPSGQLISFCGAGRGAYAPGGLGGKLAHLGISSGVFTVKPDGTGLEQVATTGDDQEPTWSKDSSQIAVVATAVFSITTVASHSTQTVASAGMFAYGEAVWIR
jgi:Tol biopolymer transport system component